MNNVRFGPKRAATDPLPLDGLPEKPADQRIWFIETYGVVPKGTGGRGPFQLRPFQKKILRGAFKGGIRTALVSMPRANGKTGLAAAIAVSELFLVDDAEVLFVASDQRQAGIGYNATRRMIELHPELSARAKIYSDRIEVPSTNAVMRALPADPDALHGWDPSLLVVDELHTVTDEVWQAATSMAGKRPQSLTLAISTPGVSEDCVMWRLVQHGRLGQDKSFYFIEFAADQGCDLHDKKQWRKANPGLACKNPFLQMDGMEAVAQTVPEPQFRQLRLGQWVSGHSKWLPVGAWERIASTREVAKGTKVCLGFDGSSSGDSTVLIGCTVEPTPHVFVVGVWERTGYGWKVPRAEVTATVTSCFKHWKVVELACDPHGWRSEIEEWAKRHGEKRVIEFNTGNKARMAPATDRLYQAILDSRITHDGNPQLAAHIANTHAEQSNHGAVIRKDKRNSARKIDAAVATVLAVERAAHHANKKPRRTRSFA